MPGFAADKHGGGILMEARRDREDDVVAVTLADGYVITLPGQQTSRPRPEATRAGEIKRRSIKAFSFIVK